MTLTLGMLPGRNRRPIFIGKGAKLATGGAAVVSYPADIVAGDLLILIIQTDQSDSVTTPAGWTLIESDTSNECDLRVYRKAHTTGTSVTVTWSGDHVCAQILAFRDVNATPIDANTSDRDTTLNDLFAIPGVTTTVANCYVLAMVAHDISSNSSVVSNLANANLDDGQELTDICTTAGWDGGFAVFGGYKASAGAVGNTTGELAANKKKAFVCIALAPP